MRIVFWGTPQFADTTLRALLDSDRRVVGVVTQPDRPAGRGRKTRPPPVRATAEEAGIPVLQPDKPRGDEFLEALRRLTPEISVVAAYGHILRLEVLNLPRLGSINVHASLLPELRGAAPVNWAIIRGYTETGVSVMRMVEAMDAGPVILRAPCKIGSEMTAGQLETQLAQLGAKTLIEALRLIELDKAREEPQDDEAATYAPKLGPGDAKIEWTRPALELDRWIRGTDPSPGAWGEVGGLRVQVFQPQVMPESVAAEPGVVVRADSRAGLEVATGSGTLRIGEVKPAGRRRMKAVEWIRGRGIEKGVKFC
ncbi:MAG: methionyl-tRNA formyltransferase [Gemmatimonadota bacterium]|nr:MAG: methionyl-tRNA formyltransferase [Gemmatimonadota bacterium]